MTNSTMRCVHPGRCQGSFRKKESRCHHRGQGLFKSVTSKQMFLSNEAFCWVKGSSIKVTFVLVTKYMEQVKNQEHGPSGASFSNVLFWFFNLLSLFKQPLASFTNGLETMSMVHCYQVWLPRWHATAKQFFSHNSTGCCIFYTCRQTFIK